MYWWLYGIGTNTRSNAACTSLEDSQTAGVGDESLTEEREPSPFTAVEDVNFI